VRSENYCFSFGNPGVCSENYCELIGNLRKPTFDFKNIQIIKCTLAVTFLVIFLVYTHISVEYLALLLHIWQVSGSNPRSAAGYAEREACRNTLRMCSFFSINFVRGKCLVPINI
jgi:hypothetical protein